MEQHYDMVARIAKAYYRRVQNWWPYEYEDLFNVGIIGLIQARERYCESHGTSFETFAHYRIAGAIADEIRDADPRTRAERKKKNVVTTLSIDEIFDLGYMPEDSCGQALLKAIESLPEDMQRLCWKRIRGKSYRQIGKDLGLTESRICQIFNDRILPVLRPAIE